MNRNQKIALGCGAGGCLGLILLVIVCVILVISGVIKAPGLYNPDRGSNYNYNRNSNFNANLNTNDNLNANSDSSDSSSSLADDDKHKLFQAGNMTQDQAVIRRVWQKIGLMTAGGAIDDDYGPFVREHIGWGFKNSDFVQSVNTPEKARAYVDAHIDD